MFRDRFTPRRFRWYGGSLASELSQGVRSKFVLSDTLRFLSEIDGVCLTGTIECEGGIRIEVEERLRYVRGGFFVPRDTIELVFYRYNMVLRNESLVFRYNSPHKDHNQFHHVHRYDVPGTGEQIKPPTRLRERDVPTLRQVLQEAERWYYQNVASSEAVR